MTMQAHTVGGKSKGVFLISNTLAYEGYKVSVKRFPTTYKEGNFES